MNAIAVSAIHLYRRHISPRKGFRCAHHVLHGCGSCSDFGLQVFARRPFAQAFVMQRRRFQECVQAKQVLILAAIAAAEGGDKQAPDQENQQQGEQGQKPQGSKWCHWSDACNIPSSVDICSGLDLCSGIDICACSI